MALIQSLAELRLGRISMLIYNRLKQPAAVYLLTKKQSIY